MKEIELTQLIKNLLEEMRKLKLSERTLIYYRTGLSSILSFFEEYGRSIYSKEFLDKFLKCNVQRFEQKEISSFHDKRLKKASSILAEYESTGILEWKVPLRGSQIKVNEYFSSIVSNFVDYMTMHYVLGIRYIKANIQQFVKFLEDNGHTHITEISMQHIKDFLIFTSPNHRGSMHNVLHSIKKFVGYINEIGLTELTKDRILFKIADSRKKVLPCFSHEEVQSILAQINTNTIQGKRDFAIIYLAAHTGLRGVDILNLKLMEIDWKKNEINVIQKKTRHPLILPFEPETGEVLADYILSGRPEIDSPYVFLRIEPPYKKLSNTASTAYILEKYMRRAGIKHKPGDGKSFHGLRRSMGTWMLQAGVPLTTISQVLGHWDFDSTKQYLSLDFSMLSECALDLQNIKTEREELL